MDRPDHLWLCAGQSNMIWPFAWMPESARRSELEALGSGPVCVARVPFRAFIERDTPLSPLHWQTDPRAELPAIPSFLSRLLHQQTGKTHGMVVSAIGGSRISSWIPREAFGDNEILNRDARMFPVEDSPEHAAAHRAWQAERAAFDEANRAREAAGEKPVPYTKEIFQGPPGPRSLFYPGGAFAAMIRPLAHLPFRGVIWYQGESDAETPEGYADRLSLLIQTWRDLFRNPDLPFIVVGLPRYSGDEHAVNWPQIREQQQQAANTLHGATYVNCSDLGEDDNIHPSDKSAVAARLVTALLSV